MKRTLYLLSLLTLAACSNDDNAVPETNVDRTEITFSSNLNTEVSSQPMTRTLAEDGFDQQTRIVMRIKSEDASTSPTSTKYTRTKALAAEKAGGKSTVTFDSGDKRYWDDAHGRNSQLSVYAVAIENDANNLREDKLTGGSGTWFTETPENENIEWTVSTTQTTDNINKENLVYSNNIQVGTPDARLKFVDNGTGHGTFQQGELKFNHALTRITVKLTYGPEFSDKASWAESDVKGTLPAAPVAGTLDLKTGEWTLKAGTEGTKEVTMATVTAKEQYTAQILPGLKLEDGSNANVMAFTVKGNVYYITSDVLYDKLNTVAGALSYDYKLLQGKHYVVNVTVTKTQISAISARVVGWDDVVINNVEPSNAYISLTLYGDGTYLGIDNVHLYRLAQTVANPGTGNTNPTDLASWDGAYEGPAFLIESGTANVYKTNWYFESNATYYHFRTTNQTLSTGNKNFNISSGLDSSSNELDPHWGAPMKDTPKYDAEQGFADHIHAAIGVTKSEIKLTEFHMLSNVIIKLTTTDGTDKVDNLSEAKVELLKLAKEGSVKMGSGLITPSATLQDSYELKYNNTKVGYFSPIVPQSLDRGSNATDKVGIRITAKDNNVYQVEDISEFTASSSSNTAIHAVSNKVARWYPNTQYTYTFKLKKTGIDQITCTVTEWDKVEVEGGEITIQ